MKPRKTYIQRSAPPRRSGRPKAVNRPRRASTFARCYGSKARVAWVRGLPCAACGVLGASQNAHVLGPDGMGRKGGYAGIAPLCGPRGTDEGCHRRFDTAKIAHAQFDPVAAAAGTERAWLAHTHTGAT